uniref:Uncharacterized protein n=1 Tax=Acrobeloides nanus TaxID=290746 RepID=A0A914CSX2_9BILA
MFGEFVALSKSPDYRPNAQSTQFIREAIRSEIDAQKCKSNNVLNDSDYTRPVHFRTSSTNSGYRNMPRFPDDDYLSGRRQSLPVVRGPARLLQRLRGAKKGKYNVEANHNEVRNHESQRRNSVISESEETISSTSSRRASHDSCHEQIHGLNMKF